MYRAREIKIELFMRKYRILMNFREWHDRRYKIRWKVLYSSTIKHILDFPSRDIWNKITCSTFGFSTFLAKNNVHILFRCIRYIQWWRHTCRFNDNVHYMNLNQTKVVEVEFLWKILESPMKIKLKNLRY